MFRARLLVHMLAHSMWFFLGVGLLHGQTYPSFNGGRVINDNPPPTGGPQQIIIQQPNGSTITENGLAPGAQVNLILVQGTASWTPDQATTLTNSVSTGLSQISSSYPTPTSQVTDNMPAFDQTTGFQGATTQNVVSVVVALSQSDLDSICPGDAGCSSNTVDPISGYTTSSLSYISSNYQTVGTEDHEDLGHGLCGLTDCTSCNSLMGKTTDIAATSLTFSDISFIDTVMISPTPEDGNCTGGDCDSK